MKHLIGKQLVQLMVDPQEEAYPLQQQFSSMYWKDLVPVMERLFNEHSSPHEVLAIDRLEIDLGQITIADLRADQFIPLLEQALNKWFRDNKISTNTLPPKPIERNIFEQWLYFLEHGHLPWNSTDMPKNEVTLVLQSLDKHPTDIQQLRQLIKQNAQALQRLILQHDAVFLCQLMENYTEKPMMGLVDFTESLPTLQTSKQDSYPDHKTDFWLFALKKTVIEQEKWSADTLIQTYKTQLKSEIKAKPLDEKNTKQAINQSEITPRQATEGIYVQNAGIILLHPFLTRFFDHCGLLEDKLFTDHQAASKAIHLLHYMATNTEEAAEYDLSLMKFLCGIPLNVPIEKYLKLSPEEKEEADALLQAAIQHWGALGQVSNASLQEGFLQRDGKLLQESTGWRLQIEKKTIDILLDQLPWNISIIKLPWMKDFLKTDWI